jgi:hypothetical protein
MASQVDLSWADEDELWANDGIFLADETYRLLYDCQRQVAVAPVSDLLLVVKSSSPSRQHTPDDDRDFTSAVKSTTKARQVPLDVSRNCPPGSHHVHNTSLDVDRLKRGSFREGCSLVPPKPDPSPCFGFLRRTLLLKTHIFMVMVQDIIGL